MPYAELWRVAIRGIPDSTGCAWPPSFKLRARWQAPITGEDLEKALNTTLEPTVQLVDDDDAVRDSLKTLLESHGLKVRDYKSAAEFLSSAVAGVQGMPAAGPASSGRSAVST